MKGIICAGGSGSRLNPLTLVTNKHLLAVYDKPMIFYPLFSLIEAGIKDIMVVCSNEHSGPFQKLLGSGRKLGVNISFKVQDESGGIAEAVGLCESFAAGDNVAVVLGDNIFEDSFLEAVSSFKSGACLFIKEVVDPERFGVAEVDDSNRIINIEEKPVQPKSNLAITGFYIYDNSVFKIIRSLNYSDRNELEITDVNNFYVSKNSAKAHILKGEWTDAGTFESLYKANTIARKLANSNSSKLDQSMFERKQAGLATQVTELKQDQVRQSSISSLN
jgi:glucose-1-phosphate thymidylyltransferase